MSLLVLFLLVLGWNGGVGQLILNSEKNRLRQIRRKEDYTFESKLKRATEECSYIAKNDDDSHREELLERIKSQINNQKVVKFYEEREEEKKRSKKYYENVEKEARNRALGSQLPHRGMQNPRLNFEKEARNQTLSPQLPRRGAQNPRFSFEKEARNQALDSQIPHRGMQNPRLNVDSLILGYPPRRTRLPEVPPLPPWVSETFEHEHHEIFKRSKDPSFFQGTFKDHNNCFSRCVFARMELVDSDGFPHESYLRKALEDYIHNRKIRYSKIRRVYRCFDEIKKVAIDDNCIYSTRIFKCMKLDDQGTWS